MKKETLSKDEFIALYLKADERTKSLVEEILMNPQSLSNEELTEKVKDFLQEQKEN